MLAIGASACASVPGASTNERDAAQSASAQPAREEVQLVHEIEGIREYRLDNGLKVVFIPDPSVATVTVNVTYMVGSRHEGPGEGGMAHLLEHMVFKGTPTYPNIWGALQDRGAQFNGTTSADRTNYYETLPASDESLRFALEMEADRMIHSTIRAEDLATEMTVVRNEFERTENSPQRVLYQQILSTAYTWHAYGRPTIGNRSEIERVPVENLRRFYRHYYQPDNAMLVIAGRFDQSGAMAMVEETFGKIPKPTRTLEPTYAEEPPQDGPRSIVVRRVGGVSNVGVAYHVPAATHADAAAISVLTTALGDRPSGRLYTAMVGAELASSVFVSDGLRKEPGLVTAMATLPAGGDHDRALATMIEVLEKRARSITAEEVERAKNRLLKEYRTSLADSRYTGVALSTWEALGDWRLLFLSREQLRAVAVEDVARVAERYFIETNRTSGQYLPTDGVMRVAIEPAPDLADLLRDFEGTEKLAEGEAFEATAANIELRTARERVGEIDVALLPKGTRGERVNVEMLLDYGSLQSLTGHARAAALMATLMSRGTQARDHQTIRDALDRLEADVSISGSPGRVSVRLRTTRPHLAEALALVAEMLRTPSFPADDLEILRREQIGRMESSLSDPQMLAYREIYRALATYPPEDPRYIPTGEEAIAELRAVTREEIARLHRELVGGSYLDVSVVGDFDPEEVKQVLGKQLGDWRTPAPYERIARPYAATEAVERVIDTPDKQMAIVMRATSFPMRSDDPAYPAARFAAFMLGESVDSRLMRSLRQREGLSYGASASLDVSDEDERAWLIAYAICAPQNVTRAQALLTEELERWASEAPPAEELASQGAAYREALRTRLGSDSWVAEQLARELRLGRAFTFHRDVVDRGTALGPEAFQQALRGGLDGAAFVDLAAGDVSKFGAAQGGD
jgi:zinc protease